MTVPPAGIFVIFPRWIVVGGVNPIRIGWPTVLVLVGRPARVAVRPPIAIPAPVWWLS